MTSPHLQPIIQRPRRAFTLLEVLITVLIIGIISSMVAVNVSAGDASSRLDRASQIIIAACRFARIQAMGHAQSSGTTFQPNNAYGIQIDTSANTITVYRASWNGGTGKWTLPGSAVSDSLYGSGTAVINFNSLPTCQGIKISAVSLTGTSDTTTNAASPYYCQWRPFGDCWNPGSTAAAITLSYGGQTRSINIPQVGDPTEN